MLHQALGLKQVELLFSRQNGIEKRNARQNYQSEAIQLLKPFW
jgi:hypothetical protein